MTNTRPRAKNNRQSRRERRATVASALARTAAQPRSTAKVYDTAPTGSAAKVYDTAPTGSAAKVYSNPGTPAAPAAAPSASQPRSPAKKPAPAQPRSAAKKSTASATAARRSYIGEPAPADHSGEFRTIRHDLRRILVWASILIVAMILLSLFPHF